MAAVDIVPPAPRLPSAQARAPWTGGALPG
jgi:hypothetical protein